MTPSGDEVEAVTRILERLVGEDPPPRFFNATAVVAAEESGLPIADGMLGRVLETPPAAARKQLTLQVCAAVRDRLVREEVENRCHNLHSTLFLMLDAIGIPSVWVRGSVYAETVHPPGSFYLNSEIPRVSVDHVPGHSWVTTPDFSVIDLALAYQNNVGGTYAAVQSTIPAMVEAHGRRHGPAPRVWFPDEQGAPIDDERYANASKYIDVMGWTEFLADGITVRYLPSAVNIPFEDLDGVDLLIGGLRPDQAFERYVLPELEDMLS